MAVKRAMPDKTTVWLCRDLQNGPHAGAYVWMYRMLRQARATYRRHQRNPSLPRLGWPIGMHQLSFAALYRGTGVSEHYFKWKGPRGRSAKAKKETARGRQGSRMRTTDD